MTLDHQLFCWFHVEDGVAVAYPDTREIQDRINAGEKGWYGTVEGTILYGGVQATAFERRREKVYDTALALSHGTFVERGHVTKTVITATHEPQLRGHRYESPS